MPVKLLLSVSVPEIPSASLTYFITSVYTNKHNIVRYIIRHDLLFYFNVDTYVCISL